MGIADWLFGSTPSDREKAAKEGKLPILKYGDKVEIWPEGSGACFGEGIIRGIKEEHCGGIYSISLGFYYEVEYPNGKSAWISHYELRLSKEVIDK